MARKTSSTPSSPKRKLPPATSPEEQENRMIMYANQMAEEQLRNGTAPPSLVLHYVKLGTEKEKLELEKEILRSNKRLLEARADQIDSSKSNAELYENAINAMRRYGGGGMGSGDDEE